MPCGPDQPVAGDKRFRVMRIATYLGHGQGMVATAVSSLSTKPPSILACVNKSATMHAALIRESVFCVNILHQSQMGVAQLFAEKDRRPDRFSGNDWTFDVEQVPCLINSQAWLVCRTAKKVDYAAHTICIGEVLAVSTREDVDPLVYADARFARIG